MIDFALSLAGLIICVGGCAGVHLWLARRAEDDMAAQAAYAGRLDEINAEADDIAKMWGAE